MKKFWKRWLCVALALSMLAVFPIPTLGEEDVMEWTYDNSIVVTINTDTPQQFTPEDFPGIECERVLAVSKSTTNEGIIYKLVLVLRDSGEYNVEKAIEIVQKDSRVQGVRKNDEYEFCEPRIILNKSSDTLRIGEKIDLKIQQFIISKLDYKDFGVYFSIDSDVIDDSNLTTDSFKEYGILHFWPCEFSSLGYPSPDLDPNREGTKSQTGQYYALPPTDSTLMEMADRLIQTPGFLDVHMYRDAATGGSAGSEQWVTDSPERLQITVSGGETSPAVNTPLLNYIAEVKALKPGTATITAIRNFRGKSFTQTCTITVLDEYRLGDIDRNGNIDANDALLALQHSVGMIALDGDNLSLADVDENGTIDAADALKILQNSVGLLP